MNPKTPSISMRPPTATSPPASCTPAAAVADPVAVSHASRRQAVVAKKRVQLEEWSLQIESLQIRLANLAGEGRGRAREHLNNVVAARGRAASQLEQLRRATPATWLEQLACADASFQALAERLHTYVERHA